MKLIKNLWNGWKEIGTYIGDFQARLLLTIFYFTILVPFGLIVRFFADPLHIKHIPEDTGWHKCEKTSVDLVDAQRQF